MVKEAARRRAALERRRSVPSSIVDELVAASRRVRTADQNPRSVDGNCCAAVSIALEPEAAGAGAGPSTAGIGAAGAGCTAADPADSSDDSGDERAADGAAPGPSSGAAAAAGRRKGSASPTSSSKGRSGHLVLRVSVLEVQLLKCVLLSEPGRLVLQHHSPQAADARWPSRAAQQHPPPPALCLCHRCMCGATPAASTARSSRRGTSGRRYRAPMWPPLSCSTRSR